MRRFLFILTFVASPSFADCPAAPDIASELDALIIQAREAPDDQAAGNISNDMWQLWLKAPDAAAQEVLDRGMRQRASYDYIGAVETFDELIDYCPAYAEGYNKRAFIYFLTGEFEKSLADLDRALELSPKHVGAQSGRALTLMNLGRLSEARLQLLAALENNPWLSERFLMAKGGPLAADAEEI